MNCLEGVPVIDEFKQDEDKTIDDTFPADWNETRAESVCKDYIEKSKLAEVCGNVTTNYEADDLIYCIDNVKYSGGTGRWNTVLFDAMYVRCFSQLYYNLTRWPASTPPLDIVSKLCPDTCNGNGDCINGFCICNPGYIGEDCSINSTIVPTITRLQYDGVCNNRIYSCDSVAVEE
ncbi:von Willebrand factor D and EGF domain-containing protein-like [Patella vulgata]|uniref:von Willebrand factor D and EGF domain-containing protein-like n=1 Tax=Patella vulgata TaxID=6465 RepID=UPI0024A99ECF|nr:von Willebrand factor D and EGF domain-containing protein-like [Patella vulgata]